MNEHLGLTEAVSVVFGFGFYPISLCDVTRYSDVRLFASHLIYIYLQLLEVGTGVL